MRIVALFLLLAPVVRASSPRFVPLEEWVRMADVALEARIVKPPKLQGDPYDVEVIRVFKGDPELAGPLRVRALERDPWVEKPAPAWERNCTSLILYLKASSGAYRTVYAVDPDLDFPLVSAEQRKRVVDGMRNGIRFFASLGEFEPDLDAAVALWEQGLRSGDPDLVWRLLNRVSLDHYFDADREVVELVRRQRRHGAARLFAAVVRLSESDEAALRSAALRAIAALVLEGSDRGTAAKVARRALARGETVALEVLAAAGDPLAVETAIEWIRGEDGRRIQVALEALIRLSDGDLDLRPAVRPLIALLDDEEHRGHAHRALRHVVGNPGLTIPEWKAWWTANEAKYPR